MGLSDPGGEPGADAFAGSHCLAAFGGRRAFRYLPLDSESKRVETSR